MNNTHSTIILTGKDIEKIVLEIGFDSIMDQLIEDTYQAFVNYDDTDSFMTARSGFNYQTPHEGLVEWMPIRNISTDEVVIKVVGYHPQNPSIYQLPSILSTISRYDTKTGHLKALIDGVLPTSLRTGAIAAVASKLLAHQNSSQLGLIGCGAQAITQLHGISRVFNIEKVYYFDNDELTQNSFPSRVKILNLNCELIPTSIEDIVSQSDILSTATSIGIGEGPLFSNLNTKKWLHINAIGSDFPGKYELPLELLDKSYVCPDWVDQAIIEGECQQLTPHQIGENLATILKSANTYQYLKEQTTVFDSTGIAIQDFVVSGMFLAHAENMRLGHKIDIEQSSSDEKNLYAFLSQLKTK